MRVQRCPRCNRIINPQEPVCSRCGCRLDNHDIARINSIYHSSNVATLIYLAVLFIGALIYGFVGWIAAVIFVAVMFALVLYLKFKK